MLLVNEKVNMIRDICEIVKNHPVKSVEISEGGCTIQFYNQFPELQGDEDLDPADKPERAARKYREPTDEELLLDPTHGLGGHS